MLSECWALAVISEVWYQNIFSKPGCCSAKQEERVWWQAHPAPGPALLAPPASPSGECGGGWCRSLSGPHHWWGC